MIFNILVIKTLKICIYRFMHFLRKIKRILKKSVAKCQFYTIIEYIQLKQQQKMLLKPLLYNFVYVHA